MALLSNYGHAAVVALVSNFPHLSNYVGHFVTIIPTLR
jgi:hypothetical protein